MNNLHFSEKSAHSFSPGEKLEYNGNVWKVNRVQSGMLILDCSTTKNHRMGLLRAWCLLDSGALKIIS